MGSQIKSNEINIDISPCINKIDVDQCEHFTIRGYALEMREKDWKRCCPFPVNVFEENSLLPPLEVPKFKRWDCENCRRKISECAVDGNHNNVIVNSDTQKVSTIDNILNKREIDLNQAVDLSHDNECMQISDENPLSSQVNICEGSGQSLIKDLEVPSTYNEQNNGETNMMVEQEDAVNMEVEEIQENKKEKDFDLNCPCIIDLDEEEENDNNIDSNSFSRNETMAAMNPLNLESPTTITTGFCAQIPMKTFYPSKSSANLNIIGSSNTHSTLIGKSSNYFIRSHLSNSNNSHYNVHSPRVFGESSSTHAGLRNMKNNISHSFMKNSFSKQFCMPNFTKTSEHNNMGVIRESLEPLRRFSENYTCMHNKNPADFSTPGAGNPYMINGEDLQFEEGCSGKKTCLSSTF